MTSGAVDGSARAARAAALVDAWLRGWASAVAANRTWLTDLDAAIGDGDHGINLDRGLRAVVHDLDARAGADAAPGADAAATLVAAGRRLMGVVGGASGALYGQALLRAGQAVATNPDPDALGAAALTAAIAAITQLGKAAPGDKTMLEALHPALDAITDVREGETTAARYRRAADAAQSGADATVALVARKGRASYLGERSAGHRDPGAASSALLVAALAEAWATTAG
jgi:dihydroxyacetone kinase phosphoprotein-dependent L subunit